MREWDNNSERGETLGNEGWSRMVTPRDRDEGLCVCERDRERGGVGGYRGIWREDV